jgi:hypothetical protein
VPVAVSRLFMDSNHKEVESNNTQSSEGPSFGLSRACTMCKRDHKACDGRRPCGRCVFSGLSEMCADVHLKKRGRPRKVEAGETCWGETQFLSSFSTPPLGQANAPEMDIPEAGTLFFNYFF